MDADRMHELPRTSAPAARALEAAGITSLEDLAGRPWNEIAQWHGVGPQALRIWKEALDDAGIDRTV